MRRSWRRPRCAVHGDPTPSGVDLVTLAAIIRLFCAPDLVAGARRFERLRTTLF
jgi:hypothetical protein